MRIFNLAEELEKERKKNKELKKEIKSLTSVIQDQNCFIKNQLDMVHNLSDRIDKAIEYIEDNQEIKYMDEVDIVETEKLLNILKGSDNNE